MTMMHPSSALSFADVGGLVDDFFDALSHFEGELPAIEQLKRITALSARIVDEDETGAQHAFRREAWLRALVDGAVGRRDDRVGLFVTARRRRRRLSGATVVVSSIVERHVTRQGRVVSTQRNRCELTIALIDGHPRVIGFVVAGAELRRAS